VLNECQLHILHITITSPLLTLYALVTCVYLKKWKAAGGDCSAVSRLQPWTELAHMTVRLDERNVPEYTLAKKHCMWNSPTQKLKYFSFIPLNFIQSRFIPNWNISCLVLFEGKILARESQWPRGLKAWTVFAYSNTGIVGLNPTQGMDVCVLILCVGCGLATGWYPVRGVLPTVYGVNKLKKSARVQRAVEP
jgi:hypothetical protein